MHPDLAVTAPDSDTREVGTSVRRRIAISAGGVAVLLGAMDAYVVVSLLRPIIDDFQIPINTLERATAILTSYLLGYVAGMPLLSRVSDRYGRRLVLYLGLIGFIAGSAVSASAGGEATLVVGRAIQGVAGGALLPVTMALAADLFAGDKRTTVLGVVGGAQELGSVIGPLYGIGLAAYIGWRGIFWINIPLAAIVIVIVHFSLPSGAGELDGRERPKVDVTGGLLIALALAAAVVGLDNQNPDRSFLPSYGLPLLILAGVLLVAFIVWEVVARTKLLDLSQVRKRVFFSSILVNLLAGGALMITLVFVELSGQYVLNKTAGQATLLLSRFLIALPIGAIIGGYVARAIGDRAMAMIGMLIAAGGYVLVARWPLHVLSASYHLGPVHLPVLDTSLAITGLGLGLTIAPLSSAVLRVSPATAHGIASAALVVARMVGMLLGVAGATAWGLYRFHVLTRHLQIPLGIFNNQAAQDAYENAQIAAYHKEYVSIFLVTAAGCVLAALIALGLGRRPADDESATEASAAY